MPRPTLIALALSFALPLAMAQAEPADVAAAVSAPGRPAEAIALDQGRRPAEVLRWLGLERGARVLDYGAGTGYYSEIIGRAVGPQGAVHAFVFPSQMQRENVRTAYQGISERTPNVRVFAAPVNAFAFAPQAYDVVLMHLEYHDAYFVSERFGLPRIDPNDLVRAIYNSVKPGGVVVVVDHAANPGGDTRQVVDQLHRIDPAVVRADFERAGFVFDGESDLLRNPQDDHSKLVFDAAIRGQTDRFAYRFRRPAP